ncbi:hypothetical protein IKF33_03015 [Candidatus Saccharibacteria bacterium]|nr:hypothetical protein [Candidatus Saccharibacteria bacterium]
MSPTAAALTGAGLLTFFLMVIAFYVLVVIASWKIFEKAGEKGWKALIPVYNVYILYKIVGMSTWFWVCLAVAVIAEVVSMVSTGNTTQEITTETQLSPVVVLTVCVESILFLIVEVMYAIRTAKAFGKGGGFAVGLFFLPNIFWLILGFGKAKYNKKVALQK